MYNMEFEGSDRDTPAVWYVPYGKTRAKIFRDGEFGLLQIALEDGTVPDALKVQFTQVDKAKKAIQDHLNKKEKV